MKYKIVIWDWNGTLADDVYASLLSVNDILARRNMPPITMEQYYEYIDTPISRFYAHLFDLNELSMDVIAEEFQSGYSRYFDGLHAGAPELLRELRAQGVRQVILSSSSRANVLRDTGAQGVQEYFDEILGADDLYAAGKVERGKNWIAGQEIPKTDMVMIGDCLHDYETARAMGVDCILCAIGHQSEVDLRTAGVPVVTEFRQLRQLLGCAPSNSEAAAVQ